MAKTHHIFLLAVVTDMDLRFMHYRFEEYAEARFKNNRVFSFIPVGTIMACLRQSRKLASAVSPVLSSRRRK